jgi:hypothetical protein
MSWEEKLPTLAGIVRHGRKEDEEALEKEILGERRVIRDRRHIHGLGGRRDEDPSESEVITKTAGFIAKSPRILAWVLAAGGFVFGVHSRLVTAEKRLETLEVGGGPQLQIHLSEDKAYKAVLDERTKNTAEMLAEIRNDVKELKSRPSLNRKGDTR